MGYVGWIGTYEGDKDPSKVHQIESQFLRELLGLGAVLYCTVRLISNTRQGLSLILDKPSLDTSGKQNWIFTSAPSLIYF